MATKSKGKSTPAAKGVSPKPADVKDAKKNPASAPDAEGAAVSGAEAELAEHRFTRTFILGPGTFDRDTYDTEADEHGVATSATQAGYRLLEDAEVTLDSVTERPDGIELVYSVATVPAELDEVPGGDEYPAHAEATGEGVVDETATGEGEPEKPAEADGKTDSTEPEKPAE